MPEKDIVQTLMALPLFEAAWVLWLLFGLSLVSVAIMLERSLFYRRRSIDSHALQDKLRRRLSDGDFEGAAGLLRQHDALESNVVLCGLLEYRRGPEAVEEVLGGAEAAERLRYSRRLSLLASIGSNAPFVGLFGTVLGIIRAFRDLSSDFGAAGNAVMAGVSEALVATAVGLLVAIPALVAYNSFTRVVKVRTANGVLLRKTLLAQLKSDALDGVDSGVQGTVHSGARAERPADAAGSASAAGATVAAIDVDGLQRAEV